MRSNLAALSAAVIAAGAALPGTLQASEIPKPAAPVPKKVEAPKPVKAGAQSDADKRVDPKPVGAKQVVRVEPAKPAPKAAAKVEPPKAAPRTQPEKPKLVGAPAPSTNKAGAPPRSASPGVSTDQKAGAKSAAGKTARK